MLKTKRSDALIEVAKRRRELLGNSSSAESTPKPSTLLVDDDIFDVEADNPLSGQSAPAPSSPQKTLERTRSNAVSEKLKAILEDTDIGEATHSKSSRSRSTVVSHSMLLAQQKLSMLKALEESSLQASILPSIVPAAIADFDDEDDDRAHAPHASASAADSTSPEFIHLKFMSKTKQQVVVAVEPKKPLFSYYSTIASKFGVAAVKVMCEGRPIESGDSAESLDLEDDFGLDVLLL